MPLSEHEQRQLDQIEQALYAEHPRFARAVRSTDPQVHYKRRVVYAVLVFVAGLALLLVGVAIPAYIWLSVAGFIVMLTACYWAASSYRRMTGIATGRVAVSAREAKLGRKPRLRRRERPKRADGRAGGGIGERLEERWRRRQEGRD